MQATNIQSYSKTSPQIIYLLGGFVLIICFLVFRIALIFSYSPEIGGIDNNFVYTTSRILAGYPMYSDPSDFPFAITLYPPLYFELCNLAGKIFHVYPENTIQVYRLCRTISLLCDITTLFFLFQILLKGVKMEKGLSILLTSVFGTVLCYLGYSFSRCDSLFLCLYAALFYILLLTKEWKLKTIILLSVLSVACIFSKQNGVMAPLICIIWLLILSQKKYCILFLSVFIIIFCMMLLFYCNRYGSNIFLNNIVKALQNRISWSWFYGYIFKKLTDSLLIVPLLTALSISIISIFQKQKILLPVIYLLQCAFSFLSSLKYGSSLGYFYECLFLCPMILFQMTFRKQANTKQFALYVLPFIILFGIFTYSQGYLFFLSQQSQKKEEYQIENNIKKILGPKVRNGYILNLANPNRTFFKTIFYKQIAVPNIDMVDCCTLPDGNFDYHILKEALQNGAIKFIITPKEVEYNTLWGVCLSNFRKDTTLYQYGIYQFYK